MEGNALFEKLLSAETDIKARLEISEMSTFVSDKFLIALRDIILLHSDDPSRLLEELHALVDKYENKLERIRWELARIPTTLIVKKYSRPLNSGIMEHFIGLRTHDGSHEFSRNAPYWPDYVPDLENKADKDTVWCLCSQEQARELQCFIVPCWDETDSLVDWITDILRPTQQEKDTDSSQTPQQSSIETDPLPDTQPSRKQLIYDYIQTNAPVETSQILEQKFAGRSRTFAILKDLEQEDKIHKLRHGVYEPL